ncbi:10249_t:CDS:2, partial [Racocetra fulgida]
MNLPSSENNDKNNNRQASTIQQLASQNQELGQQTRQQAVSTEVTPKCKVWRGGMKK